jgi:molecular chaperone DnaK
LITDISMLRLQRSAELAKIQLSDYPHAKIIEDNILTKENTREKIMEELSREEFDELIQPLLGKTIYAVHQALADAQLKPKDIDAIILVGGATRSPVVENMLARELGKQPRKDIHPELAVAYGAGVMAARLMGEEKQRILIDITPYTFGTSCLGVVDGEYCDYMYVPVLKAGTPLPASKAESFYTEVDEQEAVEVKIFQGENPDARKDILVGDFRITGLSKVPSGNEIILNMRLDLDGILHVTAIEHATNLSKSVSINNALGKLTDEQIAQSRREIKKLFSAVPEAAGEYEVLPEDEGGRSEADRELRDKFLQINEQVKRAQVKMDEVDKADASRLLNRLEDAYRKKDEAAFAGILAELDDLLFYVKVD